jgi:UDP-N-acetylglucosamine 2-epimerase
VSDSKLGFVSRTEGISSGPRQVALDDSGREKIEAPSTALAFASMREVPASQPETRQAETRVAVTQQTAPVAAAAASASQETPFYKKMFSGVTDLFSTSASQPVAETVQIAPAPAKAAPAAKAVPQKRAQAPAKVNVAVAN